MAIYANAVNNTNVTNSLSSYISPLRIYYQEIVTPSIIEENIVDEVDEDEVPQYSHYGNGIGGITFSN